MEPLVAAEFLDWLNVAPEQRWFDVGCGTGALTAPIVTPLLADLGDGYRFLRALFASAREHIDRIRVRFELAMPPRCRRNSADVVVSGLVLNFLPDQAAAATAIEAAVQPVRSLRTSGTTPTECS